MNNQGERSRIAGMFPKYAYSTLDYTLQGVYDDLVRCITKFKESVPLNYGEVSFDDIVRVMKYIDADHPEIFWLDNYSVYSNVQTGVVARVAFKYSLKRAAVVRSQKKIEKSIKPFLESVNLSMSDYEAVKQIYENIITLTDYDSVGLEKSKRKRNPGVDDLRSIRGVIVDKKAVCAGYARATQYLLNRIGIECVYVVGETEQGPHAWNLLKLEGDYYYMDTTWGDHSNTKKKAKKSGIDYDHFCVTSEELFVTHTPDDHPPMPECVATRCNYHVRNGLFFDEYSFEQIKNVIDGVISRGETYVTVKFASEMAYDEAVDALFSQNELHEIIGYVNRTQKKIQSSYTYSKKSEMRIIDIRFELV